MTATLNKELENLKDHQFKALLIRIRLAQKLRATEIEYGQTMKDIKDYTRFSANKIKKLKNAAMSVTIKDIAMVESYLDVLEMVRVREQNRIMEVAK